MPDTTDQKSAPVAPLRGENRMLVNQTTMREILASWLNNKQPNDPDVDVADVYYEGGWFHVVTRERA